MTSALVAAQPSCAASVRSALPTPLVLLLLGVCVIQFTGAWVYPQSSPGVIQVLTKTFGVPFQYSVWALSMGCIVLHLVQRGSAPIVEVLLPFLPFVITGLLAATFGINPGASYRLLMLWGAAAAAAAVIGQELTAPLLALALTYALLLLMAASALMALAAPKIGTELYIAHAVWRGVFTSKNQLGWIAALAIVATGGFTWRHCPGAALLTCALAGVCLIASDSKGALLAGIGALGARLMVGAVARRVSAGLGILIVAWSLLAAAAIVALLSPLLLALMQRDLTLTGRTGIWQLYLDAMLRTPWLGEGPGSYTSISPLTLPLANRLIDQGMIVTPHSSFLGAFGDAGLLGLLTFAGALLYVGAIAPNRRPEPGLIASAAVAFLMVFHGLVETHEVLNAGFGWFLLILMRSLGMRVHAPTAQGAAHGPMVLRS